MSAFIYRLRSILPKDFFDDRDLRLIFRNMTANALRLAMKRAVDGKHIIQLKKGFYVWAEDKRRRGLMKFSVAGKLSSPSYISFQSALSYHGLIPEAVFTISSAHTLRKSKNFATPIGEFSYQYIPTGSFSLGVTYEKSADGSHFLVATPLKALLDLIYVTRKCYPSLQLLEEDLRIDREELYEKMRDLKQEEIKAIAVSYKKQTTERLGDLIVKEYFP